MGVHANASRARDRPRREIIGLDVGEAETEAFWTEFLRSLVARGLEAVRAAPTVFHVRSPSVMQSW
jgi:transposase-like protein